MVRAHLLVKSQLKVKFVDSETVPPHKLKHSTGRCCGDLVQTHTSNPLSNVPSRTGTGIHEES